MRRDTGIHLSIILLAFASSLFATSCGGGGGGGGGPLALSPNSPDLPGDSTGEISADAHSLDPKSSYSDADIQHFLMRTHFGIKKEELLAAQSQGLSSFIDNALNFPALNSTLWEGQAAERLVNPGDLVGYEGKYPDEQDLIRWWLHLMLVNPNPLQESIALFWHDHFAVSSKALSLQTRWTMTELIQIFRNRDQALGSFRDLVIDVSKNGAMLVWLNGVDNKKTQPNENFAREIWELFMLGVENSGSSEGYTQADIEEAARAFTGYSLVHNNTTNLDSAVFKLNDHDPNSKSILGSTIAAQNIDDRDYDSVVDITLQNRREKVARFIAKKVLQWFVFEAPSDGSIDALAQSFLDHNWDLKEGIFRPLFKSKMFYSVEAKLGLIRNPLDSSIGFLRTTGLMPSLNLISEASENFFYNIINPQNFNPGGAGLVNLEMVPTQPPDVNGFNMNQQWLGAQPMICQTNWALYCMSIPSYQNIMTAAERLEILKALLPSGSSSSAESVVDELATLLHVQLTASERAQRIEYMNTKKESNGSITSLPFNAADPVHIQRKLRGLLWMMAQHPTFFVK